jgi:hypothetical protein
VSGELSGLSEGDRGYQKKASEGEQLVQLHGLIISSLNGGFGHGARARCDGTPRIA